jgi:hypothetical protein
VVKLAVACGGEDPTPSINGKAESNGHAQDSPFNLHVGSGSSITDRVVAYLAKVPPAVEHENGHSRTFCAARAVVWGFNLGAETGFHILRKHYSPHCKPPWSDEELWHKCQDADKPPFTKRRGWLLEESTNGSAQASDSQPEPGPWEAPLPLGDVPGVEPFPLAVFPDAVVRFIESVSATLHCPNDYVAVPALVLAGFSIGASRALEIKQGWEERASVYAAVIAPTGSAKSPSLGAAMRPIQKEQERLHEAHLRDMEDHEENRQEKKPIEKVLYTGDCTVEKLAGLLQENRRGILYEADELVAWVNALNQYKGGRGADRQFYLSGWSGEPVSVHRKNQQGSVFVRHPFISVLGGLPPALLRRLRGDKNSYDGFFERILFTYPTPPPAEGEDWACISHAVAGEWSATLAHLRDLQMERHPEKGEHPKFVELTSCGRKAWERFTNDLADQRNDALLPEALAGCYAKMKGYCARLALILHELRFIHKEVQDEKVDGWSVGQASKLVAYFQSHARKVYAVIDADEGIADAKRVLAWLANSVNSVNSVNVCGEVSKRDIHAHVLGSRRTVDDAEVIIGILLRHGYLRPVLTQDKQGPGRRPSPRFEVHPSVFSHDTRSHNSHYSQN